MDSVWYDLISQMFEFGYNFIKIPFSIMGIETNLLSLIALIFVLKLFLFIVSRVFGTTNNANIVDTRSYSDRLRDSQSSIKARRIHKNDNLDMSMSQMADGRYRINRFYGSSSGEQMKQKRSIRKARRKGKKVDMKSNIKAKKKGSVKKKREWWGK